MPKVGMEPLRKQQVINATMACIHEEGIARTSLQRIAGRAGITPGLILHYFDGKDGLFEAVYHDLYARLEEETTRRLDRATTPTGRLFAVLEAQVCAEMVEPHIVSTWFTLGAKAPETPALARMETINTRQLTDSLTGILRETGQPQVEAKEVSEELIALIYGLWTNLAHKTISTPEEARAILFRFIRARVPKLAKQFDPAGGI